MTIAVCYVSPEGLVLGADSTATVDYSNLNGGYHFFNHNQKIFEVGKDSTLAVVTWGLAGIGNTSHRTLLALFADDLIRQPPKTVLEAAERWSAQFFDAYSQALSADPFFQALKNKPPFDPADSQNPRNRSQEEEKNFSSICASLVAGFIIGGYCLPNRQPSAYAITTEPLMTAPATPEGIPVGMTSFRGVPNIILRVLKGYDENIRLGILNSGKWTGTPQELASILDANALQLPHLPIRDAVDYVHTCIASTIKAMKFSQFSQVCGGPIELAVITTDRPFRWVRHKPWDAAINEGICE